MADGCALCCMLLCLLSHPPIDEDGTNSSAIRKVHQCSRATKGHLLQGRFWANADAAQLLPMLVALNAWRSTAAEELGATYRLLDSMSKLLSVKTSCDVDAAPKTSDLRASLAHASQELTQLLDRLLAATPEQRAAILGAITGRGQGQEQEREQPAGM